jgi:hypothetical protein
LEPSNEDVSIEEKIGQRQLSSDEFEDETEETSGVVQWKIVDPQEVYGSANQNSPPR